MSKNKSRSATETAVVPSAVVPSVVVETIPAPVTPEQKGSPRGGTIKGFQKMVRENPNWTDEEAIANGNADAVKQGYTYVLTAEKLKEWKEKPANGNGKGVGYASANPTMDELLLIRSTPYEGGLEQLQKDVEDYFVFEARFAKLLAVAETVGGLTKLGKAVAFWSKA